MDLIRGTPGVLLLGQRCGRRREATRDPAELLWRLHVQLDPESGRAKQAHSRRVQGLGRESHRVLCSQKIQDCFAIQV